MLNVDVRPTSLRGVKRLARQIRNDRQIPLSTSLDLAARAAGCESYRHFRNRIDRALAEGSAGHELFLTCYWAERRPYRTGRETIAIRISRPLIETCTKREMKLVRGLCDLRLAAPDHLVSDGMAQSQTSARSTLAQAVRAIMFMEGTGLRPYGYLNARKAKRSLTGKLPGTDHPSDWVDPISGQYILVDEPYSDGAVTAERAEWAQQNGWSLTASEWAGMYGPPYCRLFVAADSALGIDLGALLRRIDALPPVPTVEEWPGTSVEGHQTFYSPLATTPQDRRRARAACTVYREPSRTTVPYGTFWGGRRRRPNAALTLTQHREIGLIVKALLASPHRPWAVKTRLEHIRCTLEDWCSYEVAAPILDRTDFLGIYYRDGTLTGRHAKLARSQEGVRELLAKLRGMLEDLYPDCAPLRGLTTRIATSLRHMDRAARTGEPIT